MDDTPAMLNPHETLRAHVGRKAPRGRPKQRAELCRFMTCPPIASIRHELASITLLRQPGAHGQFRSGRSDLLCRPENRGIGGFLYVVALDDPSNPQELPPWQFLGDGRPHGMWTNAAGTRLYAGQPGLFGNTRLLDRSGRTGDRRRQRLSVASAQPADPDCQQGFLAGPGAGRGHVSNPCARADLHRQHGRVRRRGWGRGSPRRLCPRGVAVWLSEHHRHHQ